MILILFLPLLSFLLISLAGRWLGRWYLLVFSVSSQILSFLFSLSYFVKVLQGEVIICNLGSWISLGYFNVDFSFIFDPLSGVFAMLISFISSLVLTYSLSYMREDPNQVTFFSYLNFFAFPCYC